MPSYEYNKEYARKYMEKLDELKVRIPKGRKADIENHAKSKGLSLYTFNYLFYIRKISEFLFKFKIRSPYRCN